MLHHTLQLSSYVIQQYILAYTNYVQVTCECHDVEIQEEKHNLLRENLKANGFMIILKTKRNKLANLEVLVSYSSNTS